MKLFKLSFLLLAILSITACSDDDDGMTVCTQADWAGTYTGTTDCSGTTSDATVTITASGTNNIAISYVTSDSTSNTTTTYDPAPFDGCNYTATATGGGLTAAVTATRNGNEITITEVLSDSTASSTCIVTAIKN
jgi:hypothetical protein